MIYHNFAHIYDQVMDHAPYDQWTQFTLDIIGEYKVDVKTMIDLGCGTGEITARLAMKDFNIYGIDNSSDMLTVAMNKALENKLEENVKWINQDIRNLSGFSNIDMAISFCDVFNYILTEQDLLLSFRHIHKSLREGGLFLFDVHNMTYAENSLVNRTFANQDEEISFVWDCEQG